MCRMIEVPPHQLYEEVRVTPTRTALVVADMQNDFVRPGGSLCVPDAEATIPAIRGLLDLARAHGMHVVYSQDTRRDGDPEWQIWPEHAREGSWGWEIVDALAPRRTRPFWPRSATTPVTARRWTTSCGSGASTRW
jgi:nicotinamidase-related amidase